MGDERDVSGCAHAIFDEAARSHPICSHQATIPLYDRDAIAGAIGLVERRFILLGDEALQMRSAEETAWVETLQRIADDPRGPARPTLIADQGMLARLSRAAKTSPHFSVATGIIERSMRLSIATGRRFRFPPLLLLGSNGIGKTYYAGLLSAAIETSYVRIAMNMISDRGRLAGLSLNWRGARMGEFARGILKSETSSPLFFLDEIDKVADSVMGGRTMDVLVSALEEENAKSFVDEYLTIPLRLDHALWIMTANSLDTIPRAILDRVLIIRVDDPSADHSDVVTRSILRDALTPYDNFFSQDVEPMVFARLRLFDRRRIKRLLDIALGFALQDGRRILSIADLERAEAVEAASSPRSVGFF